MKNSGILYLLVGIILLGIAIALFPLRGEVLWHRVYSEYSMRDIYVTKGNTNPVVPYGFGFMGIKLHGIPGVQGILGDFDEKAQVSAASIRTNAEDVQQVYLLAPSHKVLSTGPGAKSAVAISPDGTFVAYSVATSTNTFSQKLSAWNVKIFSSLTGVTVDLGPGFAPEFFEHDGKIELLYTSMKGITVMNIASLKSFTTPFDFSDDVGFAAKISPDGKHIGLRDSATKRFGLYSVYRIASNVPLGITPIPGSVNTADDVTLTSGSVFTTQFAHGAVTIRKASYGDASIGNVLYTFPADAPYRFIP